MRAPAVARATPAPVARMLPIVAAVPPITPPLPSRWRRPQIPQTQMRSDQGTMNTINFPVVREGRPARKPFRLSIAIFATVALALILNGLNPLPARADGGDSPMAATQTMVNHALQIIANKSMPVHQRRRELRQSIENEFDFTEMSRSALGYHWRDLGPDQRAQFT